MLQARVFFDCEAKYQNHGWSNGVSDTRIIYGFTTDFCETDALMNPLIKLLLEGGGLSTAQMAQVLNLTET